MESNFIVELEKIKKPVWKVLSSYLPIRTPVAHFRMVKEYPERQGKYLRPALLLWANKMFGGESDRAILLAAAMQASEDWLLIHDDIEDHSEYRRSKPSVPKPALHKLYGYELAINAGDALHIIMWQIMIDASKKIGGPSGWNALRKMNKILLTTTEGQFQDIYWIRNNIFNITSADYYRMVFKKTAQYSIIGPLQLGALSAGRGNTEVQKALQLIGAPLGYAFQIRDDLINLIQKSNVLGKEQGGDIMEGKRTLILLHLLKNCTEKEKKEIKEIYCKKRYQKTASDRMHILRLMESYGSFQYAQESVISHCRRARAYFDKLVGYLPDSHSKRMISQSIEFVGARKY